MPESPRNTNPSSNIPPMTALSIAFPMNFESPAPAEQDPRRASTNNSPAARPSHRHDAGK